MANMLDDTHGGPWSGSWKTFLQPSSLFDESAVAGTVTVEGGAAFVDYTGMIGDDDVSGRLALNPDGSIDWVDSWHTAGQVEHLDGTPPSYEYGDGQGGVWIWDIDIAATPDSITITHSNTGPEIPRYIGVLMELTRGVALK